MESVRSFMIQALLSPSSGGGLELQWKRVPAAPCLSCAGGPRPGCRTPGEASRGQSRGDSPLPAHCHPSADAAQDAGGLLGCEHTLLLMSAFCPPEPQVLLRAALNGFFSQLVHISGIASTQLQHPAQMLHWIPFSPTAHVLPAAPGIPKGWVLLVNQGYTTMLNSK